jgi:diguanylate cyclase (GGDEF)-like protein
MSRKLGAWESTAQYGDHAPDLQTRLNYALQEIVKLRAEKAVFEQRLALLEAKAAKAQRLAYHDELTGLPNRRLMSERFLRAADHGSHGDDVAVLLIDLDKFKSINDTLGHPAGDKLLQLVGERLARSIRASDTACRLGGDEFAVLLEEVDAQTAASTAAKIQMQLSEPYVIDGSTVEISVSVGVAVCPLAGARYDTLLSRSDRAMYRDKARMPAPPSIVASDQRSSGPATSTRRRAV